MSETKPRTDAGHAAGQPAAQPGERVPPAPKPLETALPPEIGGPSGPEPTRFGDWEQKGRCTDF